MLIVTELRRALCLAKTFFLLYDRGVDGLKRLQLDIVRRASAFPLANKGISKISAFRILDIIAGHAGRVYLPASAVFFGVM